MPTESGAPVEPKNKIVTIGDEWKAYYYLVKSVPMGTTDPERIFIRAAQSYCNALLDDTRLNPLIRFYFNNPQRLRIELFGEGKSKTTHDISKVDDTLNHAEAIKATFVMYEASK